jgi:Tfp pilus assembly protein PilP
VRLVVDEAVILMEQPNSKQVQNNQTAKKEKQRIKPATTKRKECL